MEGTRGMRFDWGEWGNGGVSVQLVLLAHGTAFDISAHKLGKTWPPELFGDKLVGFEITRVTGSLMVVAVGEDGAAEGVLQGNVDMTFVGQDMIVELPIREAGSEGSGDVLQGCL